jgi:hypothetical protein
MPQIPIYTFVAILAASDRLAEYPLSSFILYFQINRNIYFLRTATVLILSITSKSLGQSIRKCCGNISIFAEVQFSYEGVMVEEEQWDWVSQGREVSCLYFAWAQLCH